MPQTIPFYCIKELDTVVMLMGQRTWYKHLKRSKGPSLTVPQSGCRDPMICRDIFYIKFKISTSNISEYLQTITHEKKI